MGNKQYEVLKRASLFLQKNNREQGLAQILLQHHLALSKTEFILNMRKEIPESILKKFEADIKKHVKTGIPHQHLTGYEYFYNRKFQVNQDVLIPRPETEELVERAIKQIKASPTRPETIIDVGTGSGVIAISLALEFPDLDIFASDLSPQALSLAQKNAQKLGARVNFIQGDYLSPFIKKGIKSQMILSNPPYIAYEERDQLSETVRDFDPALALFADKDGLLAYEKIISQAKEVLTSRASLLFEIGHKQGKQVKKLILETFPKSEVQILKDINNLDRIVLAQIKNKF